LADLYSPQTVCDWNVQAWTGLSTQQTNKNFKWTDGTPFDYSSWVQNAPVNNQGSNTCGITWIGQTCYGDDFDNGATEWDNRSCSDYKVLNSVCKKVRNQ
jgi:hypothetical protein